MMAVSELNEIMSISRISMMLNLPRSTIYCRKNAKERKEKRKPRIDENVETQILNLSGERTTYGYRRIWALLRNNGIHVNIKTVRRVMKKNNLSLPYAQHRNHTRTRYLTKTEDMNMLWETDIHYISTSKEGMVYLMSIKDCFSKRWISYELSRSCTAKDCIKAVEKAYAIRFPQGISHDLVLRTDNGPQYIAETFMETVKTLGITSEYIQKHTPEDNGDIESFHNSLKTDYIWVHDIETFRDAEDLMKYAFTDYNTVRPHSSIGYLAPEEFEKRWNKDKEFGIEFLEERKRKEERRVKNRIEKRRRLKENVSLEDGKTVQN